jgi:hypothetical protein
LWFGTTTAPLEHIQPMLLSSYQAFSSESLPGS